MTRLRRLLHKNPITLIVELGENNPKLAEIAEQAGADALIINKLEGADSILKKVHIPVGINIKTGKKITPNKLQNFDFVNFDIKHISQLKNFHLTRVAALSENYSLDRLMRVDEKAEAIDAAIIPLTQGIKNLVVGDLQNYISIIISSDLPVIIPTQRSIKPSEAAIIWDAGAKGIILTKAVLGSNPHSFKKTIHQFRIAIDDLGA